MSNTLKFGNGQWATKEGSTLAYNDENGNFKPLPFNFERAGSATRVNKEGLIEVVSNNEPRIDFSNDAKGALLLEPTRSNLAIQSSIENMIASSSNSGLVEFGNLNNGLESAEITVNGQRQWYFSTANIVAGTEYTVSFYVDSFDLSSSVRPIFYIPTEGTNGVSTILGSQIVLGRNEKTFTATANGSQFRIGLGTSSNDIGSIKIGAVQIEQGSYATSYIPTSGGIATRSADVNSNQTVPSGIIGQTEGTIFIETDAILSGTTNGFRKGYVHLNDGGYSNRIELTKRGDANINNADDLLIRISVGGVNQFDEVIKTDAQGNLKIAFAYKNGDVAVYINGVSVFTKTTPTLIPQTNNIYIGNAYNNQPISEPILDARLYKTRLSNSELTALTS